MYIDEWNESAVMTAATDANIGAMQKACHVVERDVKLSYPKKGTGRTVDGVWHEGAWYPVYGYRTRKLKGGGVKVSRVVKKHFASKPGTPPARLSGDLLKTTHSEVEQGPLVVRGFVGSERDYALWLETGTRNMAPRPFLRPALQRQHDEIERIFKEANS